MLTRQHPAKTVTRTVPLAPPQQAQPTAPEGDILATNARSAQACACGGGCPRCAGQGIPTHARQVLNSSGQAIEPDTRKAMESLFSEDFSDVRLHADQAAHESAKALGARAYTVGQDVVFGAGEKAFHTAPGQSLLAHELAHVVQQSRGGPTPSPQNRHALEQSADQAAAAQATGQPVRVQGHSAPALACAPDLSSKPPRPNYEGDLMISVDLPLGTRKPGRAGYEKEFRETLTPHVVEDDERWHASHAVGQGIGVELREGILLAPRGVNLSAQKRLENVIGRVRANAPAGSSLRLQITTGAHPNSPRLAFIDYELWGTAAEGGPPRLLLQASIKVSDDVLKPRAVIAVHDPVGGESTRVYEDAFNMSAQRSTDADKLQAYRPRSSAPATYSATPSQIKRHEVPQPEVYQTRRSSASLTGPRIAPQVRIADPSTAAPPPARRLRIVDGKAVPVEQLIGVLEQEGGEPGLARPGSARQAARQLPSSPSKNVTALPGAKQAPPLAPSSAARPASAQAQAGAKQASSVKAGGQGIGFMLQGMAIGFVLDQVSNYLKSLTGKFETEHQVESALNALQPAFDAMLLTSPKQIHAVIHVHTWVATRDIATRNGVEERSGFPMVSVQAELSDHSVEAVSTEHTDAILGGSIQFTDSSFSVLLLDVEKARARQEVERQERLLSERMQAVAALPEAQRPAATQAIPPPSAEPRRSAPALGLLPPTDTAPAPMIPGAPGPQVDQGAWSTYARDFSERLLAEGLKLRGLGPSESERAHYRLRVQLWRSQMHKLIRDFGGHQARESLKLTLFQFDERMSRLGSELGIEGWRDD